MARRKDPYAPLTTVQVATAAVAGAAAAAYLDAKFHIRHDLNSGGLSHTAGRALEFIQDRERRNKLLLYHCLEDHARDQPNRPFLEYAGRSWTYKRFFADLQRVGNWLMNDLGLQRGEMVALDGPNSAEYLMLWFALEGIGASVSFINSHLTGQPLVHSVKLCGARYLIAERDVEDLVGPHLDELAKAGAQAVWFDEAFVDSLSDSTPLPKSRRDGTSAQEVRNLIYTSGTTGLPKGVMILVGRHLNTAKSVAEYLKLTPSDKFYTCLPLYHVNAPVHPLERSHNLQEAWGNGMRPDVWEVFRQRFNIPVIHELYAATDGLGATFNWNRGEFSRNAIVIRGSLWYWNNGKNEVRAKINPDTEDLVRGEDGWVIKAGIDEPGEVLHRIDPSMKVAAFKGYFKNEEASEKRWMENVFEPNDLFFRSGDVMRVDAEGRVFFVDRLGDTFRWKSENVSTNEVSDVMGTFDQIAECNVYGVQVPHADGRCGCAMIVTQPPATSDDLDLAALAQHVTSTLPRYAVPIFLRVAPQLSYTGTFKIQKGQAKREGVAFDLIERSGSKDRLFWLPPGESSYVPYRREDWEALNQSKIKL
ncbi:hypothetical protein LTR37_005185 [Vermiconidia calcicola]|uniref:Uncharacterized protein n=1 Tax=Vermiconidia calcicola TaxID=1690605 RepID=A0ACC3NLS3_9PEZI|nr:hypothetical protein LTR37_005185 [Vermiconidia calcicola]